MPIRVANAPCSWGVLEFDTQGPALDSTQVLDQLAATGYAGTELGDWGFMPTDPAALSDELSRRGLDLIAAFVPITLVNEAAHQPGIATALKTARLLRDAAGSNAFVVLSDENGADPVREKQAGRITDADGLSPERWTTFAGGANAVARTVKDETGLRTVFHPHCAGYVETAREIGELMQRTDPSHLGLCLDTGHLVYSGADPLDVLSEHAARVWHVHFKDCDPEVARRARQSGQGYLAAVRSQLFCELGRGSVDFPAVVRALNELRYDGWIVVEQDVFPGYGSPAESARRSRAYLRGIGL
jgi:inosose dehydratase